MFNAPRTPPLPCAQHITVTTDPKAECTGSVFPVSYAGKQGLGLVSRDRIGWVCFSTMHASTSPACSCATIAQLPRRCAAKARVSANACSCLRAVTLWRPAGFAGIIGPGRQLSCSAHMPPCALMRFPTCMCPPGFAGIVSPGHQLQIGRFLATGADGGSLFLDVSGPCFVFALLLRCKQRSARGYGGGGGAGCCFGRE